MRHSLLFVLILALMVSVRSVAQDDTSGAGQTLNDRLLLAADKGDTVLAKRLIVEGADVDAATWEGATGLMFAVQIGNLPMVRLLLTSGADPDKKPANGRTALITAVRNGWIDITEFLIRSGANIDLPDNEKMTPLMHAIAVDSFYMADLLLYYEADISLARKDGIDPLMLASHLCRFSIAEKLIALGADLNRQDNEGRTPLHFATLSDCRQIMELLISSGASLENKTISGYSPLATAVVGNKYPAARLLISSGADVNSRIGNSLNPLTLAMEAGYDSLASMLRNNQARAIRWPWFNRYTLGGRVLFNGDELFTGFNTGITDQKYNLSVSLGYAFRPGAIRVLDPAMGGNYYQYWERRSLYSLSIDKSFLFREGRNGYRAGFITGISGIMTYAKYRGTSLTPEIQYLASPSLGLVLQNRYLRFHLDYSWLNLHLINSNNSRFNLGVEILINRKKGNMRFKTVNVI